jgi:phospholipid/cholesterol/gamma-HCH transport system substrate-binding protein
LKRFYTNIHKTEVKVGIFSVLIIAVLVVGWLWLSSRISGQSQRDLRISFDEVMGLEVGDQAMFRGMEVGRIRKVEARDSDILVTARINREIKLKDGARFQIVDNSLMGGSALNIKQGTGPVYLDMARVQQGDPPVGVLMVVAKATTAIDEINAALGELRGKEGLIGRSSELLDSADSAVRSVDELAVDAKAELNTTLAQIGRLTERVRQLVNDNSSSLNSTLSKAPDAIEGINGTLDSLRVLSAKVEQTVNNLNSGKGTAGKLMQDSQLYDRLTNSVASLDSLAQDLRKNPKKYIKFSLF